MKGFFNNFKRAFSLMTYNLGPIVVFTILCVMIISLVNHLALDKLFGLALKFANIYYLSNDTLGQYFKTPMTWLLTAVQYLVIAYLSTVEITGIVHAINKAKHNEKITVQEMFFGAFMSAKKIIDPKSWFLYLLLLLLLPFAGVLWISTAQTTLSIPGFVREYIFSKGSLSILLVLIYLFAIFFSLRNMPAIYPFALKKVNFNTAGKASHAILKKRMPVYLVQIAVLNVVIYGLTYILRGSWIAFLIYQAALFVFLPAYNIALIGVYYYDGCERRGIKEVKNTYNPKRASKKFKAIVIAVIVAAISYAAARITFLVVTDPVLYRPMIVAHRGNSQEAPENSMPAFEATINEGIAGQIELDVHQTADGVIVVTHDDNLKRISRRDKNVHDLTYDELEKLDVGSWFSPEFSGLHVATLDEALKLCKGHVVVHIELKPTGHDHMLEESVLEVIRENQMEDQCILTSLDANALKRVKEISPETPTLYNMYLFTGLAEDLDFADYISIEESYITLETVELIHEQGKLCFAWTINEETNIQHLVDCNIDGILTDNPKMVKDKLDKVDYRNGVYRFMREIARD